MLRCRRMASTYSRSASLQKYLVGQVIHGYEVCRVQPVPDLKLLAVDLRHAGTGSQHLHIDRNDSNNVFCIGFKTNAPDSTGVPHILEHTTLCGSQRYPVHDPFFKMLNRSVANFMNAMTGPDYTFFPFATTNSKDFNNLIEIYLDSTLNPLLTEEDFYQEGWRLEHNNVDDPSSALLFKGVVYNEMKGQVSNNDYFFYNKFQENICPSLQNSGGDPKFITDLAHQDLVDFHARNYHPSNAVTFSYGNLPLNGTLSKLDEFFTGFGKRSSSQGLSSPISLHNDIEVIESGQSDPMLPPEKQVKTSMTWICGPSNDLYNSFLLRIFSNLLLDGQSSVFYKKLIESGLAYEFSVNSGAESMGSKNLLTIGVQGADDINTFRSIVTDTFQGLLKYDFENSKVQAIIHQLELNKKDHKPDFGLQLLYSILPGWLNKTDPIELLKFDELLTNFKEDWRNNGSKIFHDLISKYILKKPCFKFTMTSKAQFNESLKIEEAERLAGKTGNLDETDKKTIFERNLILKDKQSKTEDLSCLPSLKISDIPKIGTFYPLNLDVTNRFMTRLTDTNGISYLRGKKELNNILPFELYQFLPLFADSLTSVGTSMEPFHKIEDEIKLSTGGISYSANVISSPTSLHPRLTFNFSGWSLNSKTDHIPRLWSKLLVETDFRQNKENLRILVKMLASSNLSTVSDSGHSFAKGYAAAQFNVTKAIDESLNGIKQLQLIMKLNKIVEENDDELFEKEMIEPLERIQKLITNNSNLKYFLISDSTSKLNEIKEEIIQKFEINLSKKVDLTTDKIQNYPLLPSYPHTLLSFPFQTYHTSRSLPIDIPYTHAETAALQILTNVMTSTYLHKEIREKNGAYGGGAAYDAVNGTLNYYSYRDPNPLASLDIFKAPTGNITVESVNEAKLRVFQDIDAPVSIRNEGIWNFDNDITDSMRQTRRLALLDVTKQDVDNALEKYILNDSNAVDVVLGPKTDEMNAGWNVIDI
ncbi:hypothetical protein KAFR_0E03250 [Kazachstania africana CBS 2517]|uniref:Presequence protease, mitochondrial n=1 Tax=Kazachstania africana (strain ATCC 22294 / BCRC 22015 / CBS 2517 / CECT 1963 / NBRC 1671 / NRRL Y-8276) TaxID=1071382 RepID=H2AVS7_KAZAF|nr:hypothetical protein KAFR_0E03250 [Kazachstania africana CBS 2517]CCF58477.1 hypothetical protein KAFR_0E03250 [Kazachstania africana CBS 2517]